MNGSVKTHEMGIKVHIISVKVRADKEGSCGSGSAQVSGIVRRLVRTRCINKNE